MAPTSPPQTAPAREETPDTVEWRLTNKRKRDERVFEQTELTVKGEARLLSIAREIGIALQEQKVDWDRIEAQLDEGAKTDWALIWDVLGLAAERSPDLVVDSACVFLGVFPTGDDRQPDPDYEPTRAWLAGALNFSTWTEMVKVFLGQNDYRRLAGPFAGALGRATEAAAAWGASGTEPSPSSPPAESAGETSPGSGTTSAGGPSGTT